MVAASSGKFGERKQVPHRASAQFGMSGLCGVKPLAQAFPNPALRKEREGRGTHLVGDASEIESPGHPPVWGSFCRPYGTLLPFAEYTPDSRPGLQYAGPFGATSAVTFWGRGWYAAFLERLAEEPE
jgi:hypothetical protein